MTTADLADPLHPNYSSYRKMADAVHRGLQAPDSAGWLTNPSVIPQPKLFQLFQPSGGVSAGLPGAAEPVE
ncbi:hypothetical protein ABZ614_07645 [Streptomyces sp. NPDC013178]|uniref:hypothetical protein n=1 Tax=Streptomyces sp. NPDC013178 TaxID=3155118 RepID=UPI003409C3D8